MKFPVFQIFQNFKYLKFGIITISLCMGLVFHSCGSAPTDAPTPAATPVGPTLKVNMPVEYKNGIPAGGLLENINVEISDAEGKVTENIKITYEVKLEVGAWIERLRQPQLQLTYRGI